MAEERSSSLPKKLVVGILGSVVAPVLVGVIIQRIGVGGSQPDGSAPAAATPQHDAGGPKDLNNLSLRLRHPPVP